MKLITTIFLHLATAAIVAAQGVDFNTLKATSHKITFPDGTTAAYKAYERIRYINNAIDTNSQCLSVFVPANAQSDAPIILKAYTPDFRSATPQLPSPNDETGIALRNGIVVCIVGCRGYNSMTLNTIEKQNGKKKKKKKATSTETDVTYCGKLPAPLIDLKAAVRYLRANDNAIPGSSEKIIATGSMAGGGLAALLGATADNPLYDNALEAVGAAKCSDKVMAVACFAPLTDPLMSARSGEWLVDHKGDYTRQLDTLALLIPESETPLTTNTYRNYLKEILFESVQRDLSLGIAIPDDVGPDYYYDSHEQDDYALNFDLNEYLTAVRAIAPKNGYRNYFNALATKAYGEQPSDAYALSIRQMNIIYHLAYPTPTIPRRWYIRHGTLDASVPITESITLAAMLSNMGNDVDFEVQWSGGYDCWELVEWIKGL